jgi:hypothetical protein
MSNNKEDIVNNDEKTKNDSNAEKLIQRNEQMKKQKEEYEKKMKEHYVEVLMNQTTLTNEEAKELLEKNNYNVMDCVRIFMGINKKEKTKQESKFTVNQGIYNHIRGMMDEASQRYEKQKEMEEKLQRMRETYQERVLKQNSENK